MIQDFDSQLQVSLRALQEVVAPALAGAEKHVVEQLALATLTLGFVKQRLPEARRFYRWELRAHLDLARKLDQSAALDAFIASGTAELARAEKTSGQRLSRPSQPLTILSASVRLQDADAAA